MLFKNVANQGFYIYAEDSTTGLPVFGDSANISGMISKDGGSLAWLSTPNPTEIGGGVYWYPLSQGETNADAIAAIPSSITDNVLIDPLIAYTQGGAIPKVTYDTYGGLPVQGGAIPNFNFNTASGLPISYTGGLDLDGIKTKTDLLVAHGQGGISAGLTTLNVLTVADYVWSESLPGSLSSGQAGYILGTNLNAAVGSIPTNPMLDTENGSSFTEISGVILSDSSLQSIAQQVYGRGSIYFVATNGDDSNDGLTWNKAKLSPKTTIEAASSGDMVIVGPGTFIMGNNRIVCPDNVSLIGAGIDATTITSTITNSTILKPGSNAVYRGFTILGAGGASSSQLAFGAYSGDSDSAFTNVIVQDVHLKAWADGFYTNTSTQCTAIMRKCFVESGYDGIMAQGAGAHQILLEDTHIRATAWSGVVSQNRCSAIGVLNGANAWIIDCSMVAGGDDLANYGIYAPGAGNEVYVLGRSTITVFGNNALSISVGSDSTVYAVGCEYDRINTEGNIVDISHIGSGTKLTNIPWNSEWDPEVQSEVQDALEVNYLNLLCNPSGQVILSPSGENAIADAVFTRDMDQVENSAPEHSLCTVVLGSLESSVSGSTWTIKKTDGISTHVTKTVTSDGSAEPITGVS